MDRHPVFTAQALLVADCRHAFTCMELLCASCQGSEAVRLASACCRRRSCLCTPGRYHVRNYLWVFVNAQIENPSFDSQTKETMTLKQSKFGCAALTQGSWKGIWLLLLRRSSCAIPDKMINNVLKTGIVRFQVAESLCS